MSKDNNVIQETTSLIEQLGKHIEQRHCRIAIDLVPGIVSISIGLIIYIIILSYQHIFIV